jgi:hypothetical protein
MRGDRLNRALTARIRGSGLEVTAVYAPARPVATGSSPGSMPPSPFTGPPVVPSAVVPAPVPERPATTVDCLWLDAVSTSLAEAARTRLAASGWKQGAEALARVLVADAALDPDDPHGDTIFTNCEAVVFRGHRFRVLAVEPVGAGHRTPLTYHVWLAGAPKQ